MQADILEAGDIRHSCSQCVVSPEVLFVRCCVLALLHATTVAHAEAFSTRISSRLKMAPPSL